MATDFPVNLWDTRTSSWEPLRRLIISSFLISGAWVNEKVWKDAKSIFQQHFHRRRRRRIVRSLMWCGWTHATECTFPPFFYPDLLHSVDPRNNLTTNTSGQNSISLKVVAPHLRWWMSTITAGRKMRRGMVWMSMICLRSPRPPSLLYLRHCTTSFRQASWHRLWG